MDANTCDKLVQPRQTNSAFDVLCIITFLLYQNELKGNKTHGNEKPFEMSVSVHV